MVKFGRHCAAFKQGHSLYVVEYAAIRNTAIENVPAEDRNSPAVRQRFEEEWRKALGLAAADFGRAMVELWKRVFAGIGGGPEGAAVRGALPDAALRLFLAASGVEEAQELLVRVKRIHNTALTNAEALRKLVKKFDKQHLADLSGELLPEVYGANFTVGQATLQAGISLIRASLGMASDGDDDAGSVSSEGSIHDLDASVLRRKAELDWLRGLVAALGPAAAACLVAHRGFHSHLDRSDCRPLENSLNAYEAAWTSGVRLCECDIAITKDEKLVLAHDDTFARLALDPTSRESRMTVGDLTYRDLVSLPLMSGSRPPLLIDILRTAAAIGGRSQLIVEIKPGNVAAASALARMFLRHPELMERCAVVMSFDAFAMHSLRRDLRALEETCPGDAAAGTAGVVGVGVSLPSAMSLGNLGFRVESAAALQPEDGAPLTEGERGAAEVAVAAPTNSLRHPRTESMDHFGVGLTNMSPTVTPGSTNPSPRPHPLAGGPPPPPLQLGPAHAGTASPMLPRKSSSQSIWKSSLSSLQFSPSTSPQPASFMKERRVGRDPLTSHKKERPRLPHLMLLTVAEEPKIDCELHTSVNDLSECEHWLHSADGDLDGVYLQFEPEMLTAKGAQALRAFADKGHRIGMWGYSGRDPDNWESFHYLCREGGLSFINTDLPKNFRRDFSPTRHGSRSQVTQFGNK